MLLDEPRLPIAEAADRAGVHRDTLDRWTRRGVRGHVLPAVCIGGRRYVLLCDLEAFLEALNEPERQH